MADKQVFLTLDQFKALASRIQAKQDWLLHIIEKYRPAPNDFVNVSWVQAVFNELEIAIKQPADSFISNADMRNPLHPAPTQLDLFGEEFC